VKVSWSACLESNSFRPKFDSRLGSIQALGDLEAAMQLFNLSSAEFAISNIALRRIKVSLIGDLNDPFELLPINTRDKTLRAAARKTRDEIAATRGVICFSKDWANPVLWSHYADKHRGIALGFEVTDRYAMPVAYEKALTKVELDQLGSGGDPSDAFGRMLLATKFDDWKYEKEFRVFVDLTQHVSEGGLYFCYFDDHLKLTSVVLGARCEVPISRVRELVAHYPHKVHVKRARIAFTKFAVTENRLFREKP